MRLKIQYGDLTLEVEGEYDEIKQPIEDFLKQVKELQLPQTIQISETRSSKKGFTNSLTARIEDLINENFFDEPRTLMEIQRKLIELGYHYPNTTLSPTVLQLVRQKRLRRLGEKGKFRYVRP